MFQLNLVHICYCVAFTSGTVEVYPKVWNAGYGEQVQINCTTELKQQYGVDWEILRNGSARRMAICVEDIAFEVGGKYECKKEGNRHTLTINDASLNDSGIYYCIEDGGHGPNSASLHLIVSRKY